MASRNNDGIADLNGLVPMTDERLASVEGGAWPLAFAAGAAAAVALVTGANAVIDGTKSLIKFGQQVGEKACAATNCNK